MNRKTINKKRKAANKPKPSDILKASPKKRASALSDFEQRIAKGEKLSSAELKVYYKLGKATGEKIKNVKEAAAHCGLTERILRYDLGRGRLRANVDGTFDKAELERWMQTRDGREKSPAESELSSKEKKAKAHYWTFKAKKEELLYRNSKGLLAEWKEVHTEWAARVQAVTSGLNAMPDRLPPLIVGKSRDEIREILKREFNELRSTFARDGKMTTVK